MSVPLAPDGDSYFRVSDTAPGIERDVASIMWVALAVLGVGLVVRWFFIAARPDDSG